MCHVRQLVASATFFVPTREYNIWKFERNFKLYHFWKFIITVCGQVLSCPKYHLRLLIPSRFIFKELSCVKFYPICYSTTLSYSQYRVYPKSVENFRIVLPTKKEGKLVISLYVSKHSVLTCSHWFIDFNHSDSYQCGHRKPPVYSSSIKNEESLHQRNFYICQTLRNRPLTYDRVRQSIVRRVSACIDLDWGYFELLLWIVSW